MHAKIFQCTYFYGKVLMLADKKQTHANSTKSTHKHTHTYTNANEPTHVSMCMCDLVCAVVWVTH